jgi:membrane-associated phospholipid phosphatase
LLAAYPLAMAFALVYTAEHYFSDILVGWVYAVFAFWAVNRMADALAARRAARGDPAPPPAPARPTGE